MSVAGYPVVVKCSTTSFAAASAIGGVTSLGYNPQRKQLSLSAFSSTITAERYLAGLHSGKISITCNYDQSDTGQTALRGAQLSGADMYVVMHFNPSGSTGSKGYQVLCKVDSASYSASVDDKVTVTFGLTFSNASTGVDGTPAVDA